MQGDRNIVSAIEHGSDRDFAFIGYLEELGPAARDALPMLLKIAHGSHRFLSDCATRAVRKIDSAAAKSHGLSFV